MEGWVDDAERTGWSCDGVVVGAAETFEGGAYRSGCLAGKGWTPVAAGLASLTTNSPDAVCSTLILSPRAKPHCWSQAPDRMMRG